MNPIFTRSLGAARPLPPRAVTGINVTEVNAPAASRKNDRLVNFTCGFIVVKTPEKTGTVV
jgi:hypothetical protein